VIWNGTAITDLNEVLDGSGAGVTLLYAYAINDSGKIVGGMTINNQNVRHAFLLTPIHGKGTR
jgi:probable HAF family extracellular repeat protein